MVLKVLVELIIAIALVLLVVTQIIVPSLKGTKLFWAFRRKSALNQIDEAKRMVAEEQLRQQAANAAAAVDQEEETTDSLRNRRGKRVV